jgi:IclR family mhp operon transcriptional activator
MSAATETWHFHWSPNNEVAAMSATTELIARGKLRARRRNRAVREHAGGAALGQTLLESCRTNSQRGSTDYSKGSYPPVESIQRALQVLRTVNRFRIATVNDIFSETGITKPTIVRVLETLIFEKYIARDNLCGGYRVTAKAAELWSGYSGISLIIDAARPLAIALTERTQWPAGIGIIDDGAVSLQFSTAALCTKANALSLGWRLDLFYTAMGRAYLAFCSDGERERLFKQRVDSRLSSLDDEKKIRLLLPQIRHDRFATRANNRGDGTSSIAAPIFHGEELLAVTNLSYFKDAVTISDVRDGLVPALLQFAGEVGTEVGTRLGGPRLALRQGDV